MYKDKDKQREYQREWVRRKRGSTGSTDRQGSTVRPVTVKQAKSKQTEPPTVKRVSPVEGITPWPTFSELATCSDSQLKQVYAKAIEESTKVRQSKPKPQSYNSMMVGYVPPK